MCNVLDPILDDEIGSAYLTQSVTGLRGMNWNQTGCACEVRLLR
jgi:hypothetical protein